MEKLVWKPIASAPKDGTEILLLCDNTIFVGYWESLEEFKYYRWASTTLDIYGDCGCCTNYFKPNPSHWMELDSIENAERVDQWEKD